MKDLKEVKTEKKRMNKTLKLVLTLAALIFLGIVASDSVFILKENESALIQRFGEITAIYVKEPTDKLISELRESGEGNIPVHGGAGLKFKIPFFDKVTKYSSMLITYTTPAHQVITSDKKKIYFDNNAQWRIVNPLRFYKAVSNVATARDRIDTLLYSYMNMQVGTMDAHTLITDKARVTAMLAALTQQVNDACTSFGVDVFDIRIKRTDLPPEIYDSIYTRMITERNRSAAQYRSEGDEESLKKRSETDREVVSITSEADKTAEILKGEGDSEAARIFNETYGKNPEFFEFYNLLETYKETVGESSTLVIPLESDFARYLLSMGTVNESPPPGP